MELGIRTPGGGEKKKTYWRTEHVWLIHIIQHQLFHKYLLVTSLNSRCERGLGTLLTSNIQRPISVSSKLVPRRVCLKICWMCRVLWKSPTPLSVFPWFLPGKPKVYQGVRVKITVKELLQQRRARQAASGATVSEKLLVSALSLPPSPFIFCPSQSHLCFSQQIQCHCWMSPV